MPYRAIKNVGMTEAANRIGISPERLRYWELQGIISPGYIRLGSKRVRRYSKEDIAIAIEIERMVDREGFSLEGAAMRMNRPYRMQ